MGRTYEDIKKRMKDNLKNASSKVEGTFAMDNINAVAVELARFENEEIDTIYDDLMLDSATGRHLDLKAKEDGMIRKSGESDEDFRDRIYDKVRNPISSGNKNHYKFLSKQVEGVRDAKVLPLANGNGTVKVVLLSDDYDSVNEEVVDSVIRKIAEHRIIGADVEVVSTKIRDITLDITLEFEGDISFIKEKIKRGVSEYIKTIPFTSKNKVLSYYKIGDIIFSIDGVNDILSYSINGKKESIRAEVDEFFKISEVVIGGS